MTGRIALPPVLLGIAVMFWSAGFDIIYACQDYQFDIDRKLHSIPVKFGLKQALRISYFFHIMTLTLIIFTGLLLGQNFVFYTGVIIIGALLAYEHVLVKPDEINNINKAFFVVNSWVSMVLFVFTLLSKIWEWRILQA